MTESRPLKYRHVAMTRESFDVIVIGGRLDLSVLADDR